VRVARRHRRGPDRDAAAALLYVHLRSEWMLHNVRIGYMVNAGVWDQAAIFRSSLLSSVLGIFEDALEEGGEAARVRRFLGRYNAAPAPDKEPAAPPRGALRVPERGRRPPARPAPLAAGRTGTPRAGAAAPRRRTGRRPGHRDPDPPHPRAQRPHRRVGAGTRRSPRRSAGAVAGHRRRDAADAAGQITRLTGRVAALETRLAQFTAERDLLRRELGVAEVRATTCRARRSALVGGLRQRVFRLGRDLAAVAADRDFLLRECTPVAGSARPTTSVPPQPTSATCATCWPSARPSQATLRDARERLLSEVGSADPEEIAAEVRALRQAS
jgi:hypothetical protein